MCPAFTATDGAQVNTADSQGSRRRTALFAANSLAIILRNPVSRYHGQHFCSDLVSPDSLRAKSDTIGAFAGPRQRQAIERFSGSRDQFFIRNSENIPFSPRKKFCRRRIVSREFPVMGRGFLPKYVVTPQNPRSCGVQSHPTEAVCDDFAADRPIQSCNAPALSA